MGEDSKIPTGSYHTPTITQPYTSSQPQQKQKSKKSKIKITEVPQLSDSTHDVADEHVCTTSNDTLLSVVVEKEVSTDDLVPTAGEVVTTTGVEVSTASISQIFMDEITLAKALIDIKTSKPKAKEIVIQEPSETPTPTPIDSS
nr:hypothetical protein [Tanacetum cinerariifolium]